jgi:DHA1 family tetracycline resistance protein-like MFS transporter
LKKNHLAASNADMKKSPIVVILLTIFLDMLGFGIIIPILPIFSRELGAADYQVGLIAMSYPVMNFLFASLWGSFSDRHGRRPIILISVLLTAVAYLIFGLSVNLWILLFSRILAGIGSANLSVAQAYIADISSPEQRTKSMGMIGAAFGIGFIIGPVVGGYLKSWSSVGHVDLVGFTASGLCFINFLLAYFLLPESLKQKKPAGSSGFKVISSIVGELGKPLIRELLLINFIYITAFMIMQIASTLFWDDKIGLSAKQIGYMMAFIGLVTAIVQGGLVGRMVKMFGETKLLRAGILLVMASLAMVPWVTPETFLPWQLIAFGLLALGNGCITPTITSLLSKISDPRDVGQVLGVNQSFGSLARALGMGVSGFLYGFEFHSPFLAGSVLMLGSLGLFFVYRSRQNAKAADVKAS